MSWLGHVGASFSRVCTHYLSQSPGALGPRAHPTWFQQIHFNKVITYRGVSRINKGWGTQRLATTGKALPPALPKCSKRESILEGPLTGAATMKGWMPGTQHRWQRGSKGKTANPSLLLLFDLLPVPLDGQTQEKASWLQSPVMQAEHSQPAGREQFRGRAWDSTKQNSQENTHPQFDFFKIMQHP